MKRQHFPFPGFIVFLLIASLLAACNQAKLSPGTSPESPQVTASSSPQGAGFSGGTPRTLENTPWVLRDFPNAGLKSSLALFPVTLRLNPSDMSAGGSSACNQYSTPYTLDGSRLSFGPVLFTQMACQGVRGEIESTYQPVLVQVASYQIRGDSLLLKDGQGAILLRFAVDPFATSTAFTYEELANATYHSTLSAQGTVTLANGAYRADASDSALQDEVLLTNFAAFGDVTGDGQEDAVLILFSSRGGTQTFYHLAVVQHQDGQRVDWLALVGQHLQVSNLSLANGDIVLDILAPGPNDPVCCPSVIAVQRYRWADGKLQMIAANQSD